MDRRNFLRNAVLGAAVIASPVSLSVFGAPTVKRSRNGCLNLSFYPYELKLLHAFNLARSSRTVTPDVQVQLEYDGLVGYGEASMRHILERVSTLSHLFFQGWICLSLKTLSE